MRIINFGVREDELPFFEAMSKKLNIECATTSKKLTKDTAYLLEGFDGVTDIKSYSYDEEVYQAMKKFNIRYFSLRCAGFDGLNIDLAKKYNIKFARVPSYSPNAIAEFTVASVLMLIRNLHTGYNRFRNNDYRIENLIGTELRDYTVGIMGTGKIGTWVAKIFKSFGGEVIAYDKFPSEENKEWLKYVSQDELFKRANIISLHMPLTEESYHIINEDSIKNMKNGTIIINTARGAEIDSNALYEGLKSGKLGGAILDVFEGEEEFFQKDMTDKIIPNEIFRAIETLPNTIITPHIAFDTTHAVKNMVEMSLQNVVDMNNGIFNNMIELENEK